MKRKLGISPPASLSRMGFNAIQSRYLRTIAGLKIRGEKSLLRGPGREGCPVEEQSQDPGVPAVPEAPSRFLAQLAAAYPFILPWLGYGLTSMLPMGVSMAS